MPRQVVTSINNLIIGRIYVDHGGVMRVRNAATGLVAKLRFREHSFLRSHNEHEARPHPCLPLAAGAALERHREPVTGRRCRLCQTRTPLAAGSDP